MTKRIEGPMVHPITGETIQVFASELLLKNVKGVIEGRGIMFDNPTNCPANDSMIGLLTCDQCAHHTINEDSKEYCTLPPGIELHVPHNMPCQKYKIKYDKAKKIDAAKQVKTDFEDLIKVYKPGIDFIGFYLKETTDIEFTSIENIVDHINNKLKDYEKVKAELLEFKTACNNMRRRIIETSISSGTRQPGEKSVISKIGSNVDTVLKIINESADLPAISQSEVNTILDDEGDDIRKEALEILKNGKPIEFLIQTYHEEYVGGDEYGRALILSAHCGTCKNTLGLHPGVDGRSGEGKTLAMQVVINMIPDEYKVCGKITPNALFYNDIQPGTTVFMDDVGKMDPELERIIKLSTSFYQQGAENLSVANHEGIRQKIPACINWWITGVDAGSFDIQILNRNMNIGIDILNKSQKEDHKMEIFLHQVDDGDTGREILGLSHNIKVAREISGQLLRSEQVNVKIPYLKDVDGGIIINWHDIDNSRNFPIFLDMIRVSASIHRYQRTTIDGSIIANLDDYDNAKKVWESISKEQVTKLNRQDQEVITALVDMNAYDKPVDINQLADKMNKNYKTVYQKLYGRPNDGIKGLIDRYDNIRIVEQGEIEYEKELTNDGFFEREKKVGSISKQKKLITLRNKVDLLNLNQSVVTIDREKAQAKLTAILSGSFCSSVVEKITTEKKPNSVA